MNDEIYIKTKDDLIKVINTVARILAKAESYLYQCRYMNSANNGIKQLVDSIPFLNYTYYSFWYVLIVELCKIVQGSDNQEFRIKKLLNVLENDYSKLEYKEQISLDTVRDLKKKFETKENNDLINRLTIIRDNYYAHTDKNPGKIDKKDIPKDVEIERLLNVIREIVDTLNLHLKGAKYYKCEHDAYEISTVIKLFNMNKSEFFRIETSDTD